MATVMTPAAKISSETWHRLASAHQLGARLGEETLTDLVVLDMLQFQKSNAIQVRHPTNHEESRCGADLLVWIRRNGLSRFLAIQAKKIYPNGNYKALNHRVRAGVRQIDLLNTFAHRYRAIPLYLLYNHFDSCNPTDYWHCCKPFDVEQFGCTLVPSWRIDCAISQRGQRTFPAIHVGASSLPWRCVFDCDHPEKYLASLTMDSTRVHPTQIARSKDMQVDDVPSRFPELLQIDMPDSLLQMTEPLSTAVLDELLNKTGGQSENSARDISNPEHELLYPRKLLIVDYDGTTDESYT